MYHIYFQKSIIRNKNVCRLSPIATFFLLFARYYFNIKRKDAKILETGKEIVEFEFAANVLKATLCGEIDHHSAIGVKKSVDSKLYLKRPAVLCLNLEKVGFMDSSGLGLILGRFQLCRELGIAFVLEKPSDNVMKILSLAGCDKLIQIKKGDIKNEKEKQNG